MTPGEVFFVVLLVLIGGGVFGLRRWFERMPDAREHGSPEQELRHTQQVAGSIIQTGPGFDGR